MTKIKQKSKANQIGKVKQIVKQNRADGGMTRGIRQDFKAKKGVPGGTRTHNPLLRRQPLYPIELQGHLS